MTNEKKQTKGNKLKCKKEGIQKLFKEIKVQKCKKIVHNRVECDNCHVAPIIGIRYKCLICRNFDFCEKCENTVEHAHAFLKIRDSKQN